MQVVIGSVEIITLKYNISWFKFGDEIRKRIDRKDLTIML
jgi:hypothetical protein